MTFRGDTIAAIATAPGRGGVAVIRVSGSDAFRIAAMLTGREARPGRITVARVMRPGGDMVDECVVLAFAKPCSYTGEDVVELQCHGGAVTPRRVLEACLAAGARLAERGEFTARALFNGRITADGAEGVLDLIDAKTDGAADDALGRIGGARAKRHRALYDRSLEISSMLEHALDVDEGDLDPDYVRDLADRVASLKKGIGDAMVRLREGKILREGARVVLAGAPNAGKSSLMNALLEESRAIVSSVPGTTRDVIEEYVDIGGWPVRLFDTAGLRETEDPVEREGVARANALIADADIVLALDCDIPGAVRLHAKCDLDGSALDASSVSRPGRCICVSAKTGEGLDSLRKAIVERLEEKVRKADEPSGDGMREIALLSEAMGSLNVDCEDILLAANAVRSCSQSLGRLVGAVYSDDLLDALFSRFCVGK